MTGFFFINKFLRFIGFYNPKFFWDEWAITFMDDSWQQRISYQHNWILKKIKQTKPKTILEVGCGFGRNIKFLLEKGIDPTVITGCDISTTMLQKAKKYIRSSSVTLLEADVNNLPFKYKSFDLVLIHGLLMHVKPEKISLALQEIFRVGKNILIIEQNYIPDKNSSYFTFKHSYKELISQFGGKIVEQVHSKAGLDYYYVKVR